MKSALGEGVQIAGESRPARGAWIEIGITLKSGTHAPGRAPQGARGLKYAGFELDQQTKHVAPRKGRAD